MPKAKPKKTPAPRKLRSGYEGKVSLALDRAGVEYTYESEKVPYVVPATKKNYIPDFRIVTASGRVLFIEAKGRFLPQDRKKTLLVRAQNPQMDHRILFMRNNTLSKQSKTTYGDWCEKHGVPYAISSTGVPPESWYKE